MNLSQSAVNARYAGEAPKKSSLSCGVALELSLVQKNEILADLGCGRGNEAIRAASLSRFVYGIDFTPEMIETARKNALDKNIINIEFIVGNIEKIPLPDNSIDIVISNCVINHASNKGRVYNEIFRILKPGGRFVVSDIIADRQIPPEISGNPEAIAGCYGGAILAGDYFEAIQSSGFGPVEILEESQTYEKNGVWLRSLTIKSRK